MIEGSCHCGRVHWRFDGQPDGATACNCTVCRRYGALWAYDYVDEGIHVTGATQAYVRGQAIEFHFCASCGCVAFWRGLKQGEDGRRRIAVNLRLAEPQAVANIPIDHFDGLDSFDDLPATAAAFRTIGSSPTGKPLKADNPASDQGRKLSIARVHCNRVMA